MSQLILNEDLYNLIFNELDYYTKVSFTIYLRKNVHLNFYQKIDYPNKGDIINLYEKGIDKLKLLLDFHEERSLETEDIVSAYEKILRKSKLLNINLIQIYIENFNCLISFCKLLEMIGKNVKKKYFYDCIIYGNKRLYKRLHYIYDYHYDLDINSRRFGKKRFYKREKVHINFIDSTNCYECLSAFKDVKYLDNKKYSSSSEQRNGMKLLAIEPRCNCRNCEQPIQNKYHYKSILMSPHTLTNITNKLKDYLSLIEVNESLLKERKNNRIIITSISFIFLFIIIYLYNA